MKGLKEKYNKEIVPELQKHGKYSSVMAVPKVTKVVVNIGTGRLREKKESVEAAQKHLTMITGQKLSPRPTKKAISSFKTREGMIVGYKVTLRGKRMYDFLDRLINLAIPRMRDFRGIGLKSVDQGGSLTLGIREHIVFPEVMSENIKDIFGFEITVVSNSKSRDEAVELFRRMGFPLQKTNN
ncbi:50S ribosomal protein L5 [Candidatus Giovannonibacteria bacterium]|nr:50S ribosomal protein L5 [Candidatus Giovannonibacteria bacterium]